MNPNCTNVTAGGQGMPGYVPDESARAAMRAAHVRNSNDPAYVTMKKTVAKRVAESQRGRKNTPEAIEKMSRVKRGKRASDETKARQSAVRKVLFSTPEMRAKCSAAAAAGHAKRKALALVTTVVA